MYSPEACLPGVKLFISTCFLGVLEYMYLSTRDARGAGRPKRYAAYAGEVDWWDRTRAENITITITITM